MLKIAFYQGKVSTIIDMKMFGKLFNIVGQQIDFTGDLALGLFAGGETVNVSGTVNNGVKAGARSINIDGQVTGTNFLGAEEVNWGPDSQAVGRRLWRADPHVQGTCRRHHECRLQPGRPAVSLGQQRPDSQVVGHPKRRGSV